MVVERESVVGRGNALGGTIQQRFADFAFELGELLAERRLGDEQLPRGRGQAAAFDDLGEIAQLTQVHRSSSRGPCPPPRGVVITLTYTQSRKTVFFPRRPCS